MPTVDKRFLLATVTRTIPDSWRMKTKIPLSVITMVVAFLSLEVIEPKLQAVVPAPDGGYPGFNTAEGQNALLSLTTGQGNTAVGWFTLESLATGNFNTAIGAAALVLNTGDQNTATGTGALFLNTIGFQNTANGAFALLHNSEGSDNTATGFQALFNNTTGDANTAVGVNALGDNTTGSGNTAIGNLALIFNDTGGSNTATGAGALLNNTIGGNNTANGVLALSSNTNGAFNMASGVSALMHNTGGGSNTASGGNALLSNTSGNFNTAIGFNALNINTSGNNNIALGFSAGSNITGDNNIDIGSTGGGGESSTIRIGTSGSQNRAFVSGISGVAVTGAGVVVAADGQLGVSPSSRRFKDDIKPMDKASEPLLALEPVMFRYKKEIDPAGRRQFGLVAEDVKKVNPDLVVLDQEGKPYTVRYDAVNAMLLNEFLKEHRKVRKLESNTARLEANMAQQKNQIEALTAGLQKVSAQLAAASPSGGGLEANGSATRVVKNP